jgi:hypothetical protein
VAPQITTGVLHATQGAGQIGAGIAHQPLEPFRDALAALVEELGVSVRRSRRRCARGCARLAGAARARPLDSATASWRSSAGPGRRGCPTRSCLGPGRPVVWDPFVAPSSPGPRSRPAARRSCARWASRDAAGSRRPLGRATRPPRAAVAALFAALRSGDAAPRAARGPRRCSAAARA